MRIRPRTLAASALISCILLSSCSPFEPKHRAHPEGIIPETFTQYGARTSSPDRWWTAFGSPELNALVEEALSENLTLRQVWARLDQARAVAVQAGADLYPHLDGRAGWAWDRRKGVPPAGGRRRIRQTRTYSLGLAASYEVDLWGRIRSQREAARLDLSASQSDLEAAAMTLSAQVTELWLGIMASRAGKTLLEAQLKNNKTYLELLEMRFRASLASALDLDEQQQIVAQVEAQIPLVEAEELALQQQLAVLLGKPPAASLEIHASALPEVPPLPETGLPADVLLKRPDVRAGLAQLQAADYHVAVARADRLPAISLSGGTGYQTGKHDDLFRDWYQTLAASLVLPIIDGGRRRAEVDRTRAVVEERLAQYRESVLEAMREVEEALVRGHKHREYIAGQEKELHYARQAVKEAQARYAKGQSDYLRVIASLTNQQRLERALILSRREMLGFRVDLYRALGGTWMSELQSMTDVETTQQPKNPEETS